MSLEQTIERARILALGDGCHRFVVQERDSDRAWIATGHDLDQDPPLDGWILADTDGHSVDAGTTPLEHCDFYR